MRTSESSKGTAAFLGAKAEGKNADEAGLKLDDAVRSFVVSAEKMSPEKYQVSKVGAEVLYNKIHPFRWAYIFYLLSTLTFRSELTGCDTTHSSPSFKSLSGRGLKVFSNEALIFSSPTYCLMVVFSI